MSDEFDRQALSAMIDYWISPAAVKREFEASKSKLLSFCFLFSPVGEVFNTKLTSAKKMHKIVY